MRDVKDSMIDRETRPSLNNLLETVDVTPRIPLSIAPDASLISGSGPKSASSPELGCGLAPCNLILIGLLDQFDSVDVWQRLNAVQPEMIHALHKFKGAFNRPFGNRSAASRFVESDK